VTRNAIDPERLAALLDGRLNEAERSALVVELAAADDETLHAYADAAAASLELPSAAAVPSDELAKRRARSRQRAWRVGGLALAAGVVLAIGIPLMYGRAPNASDRSFAADLAIPSAGLPALPWGVTRGASAALPASSRAVRVGAMITNLEIQNRTNTGASATFADAIGADLTAVAGGAPAAAVYRQIASEARAGRAASAEELTAAADAAAGVLDPSLVPLGSWLQAARVAAADGQLAFFTTAVSVRMLAQLDALYGGGPAHATVDRLRSELRGQTPDLSACGLLLTTLLEASGR
jgi:hypothetical protein